MSWIPQPQTPSGMAEQPLSQDEAQRGMAKPSSSPVVVDSVCRKCLPWPPPPFPHSQSEDSSPTETAPKMSQTCLLDAAAHHKLCLHAYLHETTPPPRPAILPSSWCPFSSREPSVPTSLSILCVCVSVSYLHSLATQSSLSLGPRKDSSKQHLEKGPEQESGHWLPGNSHRSEERRPL